NPVLTLPYCLLPQLCGAHSHSFLRKTLSRCSAGTRTLSNWKVTRLLVSREAMLAAGCAWLGSRHPGRFSGISALSQPSELLQPRTDMQSGAQEHREETLVLLESRVSVYMYQE
ncbi:mCG145118, partial [Mus musculus]